MNTNAPGTYEWLRFQATNLREHGLTNIGEGIERAANRMKLLEAQNARLREALGDEYQRVAPVIADYPVQPWEHLGEGRMLGTWAEDGSPYHFAIPFQLVPAFQAMQRLASLTKRPALADGKAAPS